MRWLTRLVMKLAPGTKKEVMRGLPPSRPDEEFLGYEALSSENFSGGTDTAWEESSLSAKSGIGGKTAPVPKEL